MDARVRQFRRRRRSGKCPKDARLLAVGYARERVAEGERAKTVATELGVWVSTLERSLRDSSGSFGPIELVPPPLASIEGGSGRQSLGRGKDIA